MKLHEAAQYIGIPYSDDGEGPDSYNCWGLLRHIQQVYFGKSLPSVPIGNADATLLIHNECIRQRQYFPVKMPIHGDAVLLRAGLSPHVGTWLDIDEGGVLHALAGFGVIWTPEKALNTMGFARRQYYRIN